MQSQTNDIEDTVASELVYFKPMLEREGKSTLVQREIWRKETIRERQERISLEVFDLFGGKVAYGPFIGLELERNPWWGKLDLGSQCIGLYEKEILDLIEMIPDGKYSQFIDIGAADGYYAIGMLLSKKVTKSICFEQSDKGRKVIEANWKKNGSIGEMKIFGEADRKNLSELNENELIDALVMIDIEGFEFELLSIEVLFILRKSTIILEVHNFVDNFLIKYENLLRNAAKFFKIELIQNIDRRTMSFPELRDFTDDNRLLLISERRPCVMRFLRLSPLDN